ncbi:zona pellucida-binding protein 1 isoform X1 [Suricata suricatta]|uniref:zona pellucida-binding protein 1 isoform X1 n=1 Tax=Suricata suricatta TaxID=37032 RepID=UPI001155E818|nr:zona pellucida-binding protein 1 isoform X1 [Suricata suricatta]
MEASTPGRARRGWRRARAAGSPLSWATVVLLLSVFLARASSPVDYLIRLPRGFRLTQDTVKIVGSSNYPVKVYVMLHQKSPHVLCVTQRLRNSEMIDPSFQWHGPRGKIISDICKSRHPQKNKRTLHDTPLRRLLHLLGKENIRSALSSWNWWSLTTQLVTLLSTVHTLRRSSWHRLSAHTRRSLELVMLPTNASDSVENSTTQVTSTGSLIFQNFEEEMSGVYTCFLEYKPAVEEIVKNLQLKYVIYAYREPHYYYQFTARYHAAPCNSIYNISFEKKLLQILSKLVLGLSCEVSLLKSECHHVKMQRAGLQNELFFTFSVTSLDTEKGPKPCADHNCESSKRLSKAKNLIERFFNQQVEVLGRRAEPLPEIYYIEGTLQMVWINRCFPGYGMNTLKHPKCPECCVICSPGSYNPRDGTHCLQCNSSLIYGAKACL